MLCKLGFVGFPKPADININMMPIIMGDLETIPWWARQYAPLVQQCSFREGTTVYLSVSESFVPAGKTQRRPGVHTEGLVLAGWGGGWGGGVPWGGTSDAQPKVGNGWGGGWGGGVPWGGGTPSKGIFMVSTNGLCRMWDYLEYQVDEMGALRESPPETASAVDSEPNALYWLTDRTPHEALPQPRGEYRQWFRLVADEIGVWFAQHSTANPLGVEPNAPITWKNKFDATS